LQLALEERADAVFCGGDLYEHEHFTPDTVEFVRQAFAEVDPLPIYLAPGNHDWLGPDSLYRQAKWTPNVHIFDQGHLQPVTVAEGLTLWGGAHMVPANSDNFLDHFHVDRGGVNLALFHGSEQGSFLQTTSKAPHAPFRRQQISACGLDHAFLGHFHKPVDEPAYTYPGNPDPLSFGEEGPRGAVVATIHDDGSVGRVRTRVASSDVRDIAVDVTGSTNSEDVIRRLRASLNGFTGVARITLSGTIEPSVDLQLDDLQMAASALEAASFRLGGIQLTYDFARIAEEPTVRGKFVQDVLSADLSETDRRAIMVTGLRALDGRCDLRVEQ
jgi:DNA repair exonuclease SbcCD nuclease subunit